jgi:hypothetical protein
MLSTIDQIPAANRGELVTAVRLALDQADIADDLASKVGAS